MKAAKALCLFAATILSMVPMRADQWHETLKVHIPVPVTVPGATLPAGDYVVQRLDAGDFRGIVRVMTADYAKTLALYPGKVEEFVRLAETPAPVHPVAVR